MFVAYLVPGIAVASFYSALVAALILGLVNILIKPILIILTLPINILTLGLFTFVINAGLLLIVSSIVKGFEIANFSAALMAAIVLWLCSILTNTLLSNDK